MLLLYISWQTCYTDSKNMKSEAGKYLRLLLMRRWTQSQQS
ncbi:hypothetical protein PNI0010_01744 [Streptococcus pneumoniae PNI0010]|nr:hypothetical protein PNI0010_01744 [Streptococcus pneumoniae PNI0010]ELU92609.1 hypothetical protein PNI0446_01332 [Streptococcus pneumoniae PNI0446]